MDNLQIKRQSSKKRRRGDFPWSLQILLWDPPVNQESELLVSRLQSISDTATPESLIPQVPHHRLLLTSGNQLSETLTRIRTLRGDQRQQTAGSWATDGGVCVWQGAEVGLISLHTHTHTEQLTASLPLVSGDVLHTKPLCPPPKHTLLSQRAGSSVSPPSHCALSFLFSSLLLSRPTPSPNCHLYPKLSLSQRASAMSSLALSLRFCLAFSFFFVFATQSLSKQSLTPAE